MKQTHSGMAHHINDMAEFFPMTMSELKNGRIGEAKDSLLKLHHAIGNLLGACNYLQALDWVHHHPHIKVIREEDPCQGESKPSA